MSTILILAQTAGEASAKELAISGGMSLIDGTFITAMLSGITGILGVVGIIIWKSRRDEKKRRPLDSKDLYVTCQQCQDHRAAIGRRIDELGPALNRIFDRIALNDKRSEERANQMHRRIDPLIERVAAHKADIENLKEQSRK